MSIDIDERIEAAKALTDYRPGPWAIERRHILADRSDLEYEQTRKLRRGQTRKNLKVGDSLGSKVKSIGPISPDHNHWTGAYLSMGDADADLIAAAPDLHRLVIDLAAERERLLAALREIATIAERRENKYPSDWRAQIEACRECQRYKDHPIQRGICDEHRKPIYEQQDHDRHETEILGYRAQQVARDALTAMERPPQPATVATPSGAIGRAVE